MKASVHLIAFSCLLLASPARAQLYSLTDIGFVTSSTNSVFPDGMNNSGQVIGSYTNPGGPYGFSYSGGTMTDLGAPAGSASIIMTSISDNNVSAGWANVSGSFIPYTNNAGTWTALPTLGFTNNSPNGINTSGIVAGEVEIGISTSNAAYWDAGGALNVVGTIAGFGASYLSRINNSGLMSGTSFGSGSEAMSYTTGGGIIALGYAGAGDSSTGNAINSFGDIAGNVNTTAGGALGVGIYTGGVWTSIANISGYVTISVEGINDSDNVVGITYDSSFNQRGFVTLGGVVEDLNTLLDSSGAGWTVTRAISIDDSGLILAGGTDPFGNSRTFFLTPIPEPSSYMLLLPALALLAFALHRKFQIVRRT